MAENWLDECKAIDVAEHEKTKNVFIEIMMGMHKVDERTANCFYSEQARWYKVQLSKDQNLQKSSSMSLFNSFVRVAENYVSMSDGSQREAYLEATFKKAQNGYVNDGCVLRITGYGERSIRIRLGQIVRTENPVIVFEGDKFKVGRNQNGAYIDYEAAFPKDKGAKVIGGFIIIHLPNNKWDYFKMDQDDINRLAGYSKKKSAKSEPDGKYSSHNGGIDPGFLAAKLVKHCLKGYGKCNINPDVYFDEDDDIDITEPIEHQSNNINNKTDLTTTTVVDNNIDDDDF